MRKLLFATLLVAAGCSHAPPPPAPLPVVPPRISFEEARPEELKFTQVNLTFRAKVENPNPFPLSVSRVAFTLAIEGRPAVKGQVDEPFAIPAATPDGAPGVGSINFPAVIRYAAIPGIGVVLALKKEPRYTLGGAVLFHAPRGDVEVPFQGGGPIDLPKLPSVSVDDFKLVSARPGEIVLELRLRVTNQDDDVLPRGKLDYALHIGGKPITRFGAWLSAPIPPGGKEEVVVPLSFSPLRAGGAVAKFFNPFSSIKVELKGGFDFDGVPMPLDLDASVRGKD